MYQKVGIQPCSDGYFLGPGALLLDHVVYLRRDQDLAYESRLRFPGFLEQWKSRHLPRLYQLFPLDQQVGGL